MIKLKRIRQVHFQQPSKTLDDVRKFVKDEKERIFLMPLWDMWKKHARFRDDKSFGTGSISYGLNEAGLQAICNWLRCDIGTVQRLKEADLSSRFLNDLLKTLEKDNREGPRLIVDEDENTIIGMVGPRYKGYSNQTLVEDVLNAVGSRRDEMEFEEAYSVNTKLNLRFRSQKVQGTISGQGGTGDDVSVIGIEISNTMAGGSAIWLVWYVLRLLCANGMTAKVAASKGKIVHTGRNVGKRVEEKTAGLIRGLKMAARMIETLGGIPFDPWQMARRIDEKLIFRMVPDSDSMLGEAYRNLPESPLWARDYMNRLDPQKLKEFEGRAALIAQLPRYLAERHALKHTLKVFKTRWRDDASMYDFINVFTEYAKVCDMAEKIRIEAQAGELAKVIRENKRHFE